MENAINLFSILHLIEEPIVVLSAVGEILFINQSALSLYSWKHQDVIKSFFSDLLKQYDMPSPLPKNLKFPYAGDVITQEIETIFYHATNKVILWKLSSYKLPENKSGILLIGNDVSRLKEAEEKIFELDSIIAQTPANLYWFNKDNVYLGCNETSAKLLGMTRKDATGQDFKYLMSILKTPDTSLIETFIAQGQHVIETGKPLLNIEEPPFAGVDNKLRYYLANKLPLRNKHGEIYGVIGISTDITYRKELEDDLKKLIQTMKLMGTSIAHELRTPLGSINSCVQAIKQSLLPLSQQLKRERQNLSQVDVLLDLFKIIESETKAAFNVIDMLLIKANLSCIDTSSFKIFSVAQCVAEAVDRYLLEDEERNLIDLYIVEEDFFCKGDYTLLIHVLFNLLKNALYYIHLANKRRIEIKLQAGGNYNQLIFKDSGAGIASDILPYIFENFFSQTTHGTGIGLAFCKLVLTSFGGDISCRSTYGEFTEFILTFPHV